MPRFDGTGPFGRGSGTGWGRGPCGGGFRGGAGRGFGWRRFWNYQSPLTKKEEKEGLEEEAEDLEEELKNIKARLSELKGKK